MGAKRPNKLHIKTGDTVIVMRGKDAPYPEQGRQRWSTPEAGS